MKAIIILNLRDCTYDELEEAEIKEVCLTKKDDSMFLWDDGFTIMPIPKINKRRIDYLKKLRNMNEKEIYFYELGHDDCVDEMLEKAK